jgi:hypothetical protein
MIVFFGNFVRVNEQHFDLSIHKVKELQKIFLWDTTTQFSCSEVNKINYFI